MSNKVTFFLWLPCLFDGFHLNYPSIFSTLFWDFTDFWCLCGWKKGSKTHQFNSKRLSSASYHDVKLKQFITALETEGFNVFQLPLILLFPLVENEPL